MRPEYEIEETLNNVDIENTKFPGMTYEEGIRDALEYALGRMSIGELLGE